MYVVKPRIWREAYKVFRFIGLKDGEQADFNCSNTAVEIPVGKVALVDDGRKTLTKTQPGDVVRVHADQHLQVVQRIVHVEAHDDLYRYGRPTFKQVYENNEVLFTPMTWECFEPLDFSKLEYLYKIYIVDEVVR